MIEGGVVGKLKSNGYHRLPGYAAAMRLVLLSELPPWLRCSDALIKLWQATEESAKKPKRHSSMGRDTTSPGSG